MTPFSPGLDQGRQAEKRPSSKATVEVNVC